MDKMQELLKTCSNLIQPLGLTLILTTDVWAMRSRILFANKVSFPRKLFGLIACSVSLTYDIDQLLDLRGPLAASSVLKRHRCRGRGARHWCSQVNLYLFSSTELGVARGWLHYFSHHDRKTRYREQATDGPPFAQVAPVLLACMFWTFQDCGFAGVKTTNVSNAIDCCTPSGQRTITKAFINHQPLVSSSYMPHCERRACWMCFRETDAFVSKRR